MKNSYDPIAIAPRIINCYSTSDVTESVDSDLDMIEFINSAFAEVESTDWPPKMVPKILAELSQDLLSRLLLSGASFLFKSEFAVSSVTSEEIIVGLGTHDMPKQSRLHKHSRTDYRTETASQWKVAYARFRGTSLDEIRREIVDCAKGAATASVVAAIFAENPALAYELFVPSWKVCMYALLERVVVDGVQVDFFITTEIGCWENHC